MEWTVQPLVASTSRQSRSPGASQPGKVFVATADAQTRVSHTKAAVAPGRQAPNRKNVASEAKQVAAGALCLKRKKKQLTHRRSLPRSKQAHLALLICLVIVIAITIAIAMMASPAKQNAQDAQ